MRRRLVGLLLVSLLWTWPLGAQSLLQPGDAVLFRGTTDAPEINEPIIKEGGNRVLTVASSAAERPPAWVATTEPILLSGEQLIDGVTTSGSRVLVWRQTNPAENGLYVSSGLAWTRAPDAADGFQFVDHFAVFVSQGTTYGLTVFRLQTSGAVTLGTTPLTFLPMPRPVVLTFAERPSTAPIGTLYTVTGTDSTCQDVGALTQPCWFDGGLWQPLASGGAGGTFTLDVAHATGPVGGFTDLPPTRPFKIAPLGIGQIELNTFGQSGDLVEECLSSPLGERCHPRAVTIYPDREFCIYGIFASPATSLPIECIAVIGDGPGGSGLSVVRTDRGPFASLPVATYTRQTYLVTDCNNAGCTAGGGTTVIQKIWDGTAWVNTGGGGGGAADIEAVWGCSTGDCSALTAAAGDSLDAGSATSSSPATRSTSLPGTCSEGQLHQDTDSGGSELHVCTATNTWTKLAPVLPWEIPFSAAGLVLDNTVCVAQARLVLNSGPALLPAVCAASAAGTLELSFLSPARWDGGNLTLKFVVVDSTSSSHVWSANVQGLCRTPGSETINNTFGSAVAATATMVTANVPYIASGTIAPNTACAGGDWVAIKAVINTPTHTDANARIIGGSIQGNQL